MKNLKNLILTTITLFMLQNCTNIEEDEQFFEETYHGILMSNEGNFGTPSATLSFASSSLFTIINDITTKANPNTTLGDVAQDININGNFVYVVLNNSNKVEVFNRSNLKKTGTITQELSSPRYINFSNNKTYVSNTNAVSVYNSQNIFDKKINLGDTAECVEVAGGKIWVQNAAFGFGDKITAINTTTDVVETTITLPNAGLQKIVGIGNTLYAITGNSTKSVIYEINATNNTITKTLDLGAIKNAKNLNIDNSNYYFSSDEKIYKLPLSSTTAPSSVFLSVTPNTFSTLYGMNIINGQIFTSDAMGFTANSKISVYSSTDGSLLKTFTTGIGTNKFIANP